MSVNSSYFSVAHDLILINEPLTYDLYVNSSTLESKEKFVRIFPQGQILRRNFLEDFVKRYHQLYVSEDQRNTYMKSLVKSENVSDEQKTLVIKDSAIKYLSKLFDKNKEFNTELLGEVITQSREAVESMVDMLSDYQIEDLRQLIGNLSFHDFYTYDHSINVAMYSITIYKACYPNAPRSELVHAGLGGLLHDLGKVKIPTEILNNPGKLSKEEYDEIKKHPDFGINLLLSGHLDVAKDLDLKIIASVIHQHHENLDGSGYPRKIKADEISFFAKVTAIADFFDAITTKRAYNQVLMMDDALGVMSKTVGIKIDPDIFNVFAAQTKRMIIKEKIRYEMESTFDPAIYYEKLPLISLEKSEEDPNFGKIIFKKK